MAILITTYDPKEVYIAWDGVELNSGFAPNTFLNVKPDANTFKTYNGIGGTVARTINSIQTATVTIKLLQNSDANKQLMTKLNNSVVINDTQARDLAPLTVTDRSNTLLVKLEDCYIETIPEFSLGKEYTEVEWQFKARLISGLDLPDDGRSGIGGLIEGLF